MLSKVLLLLYSILFLLKMIISGSLRPKNTKQFEHCLFFYPSAIRPYSQDNIVYAHSFVREVPTFICRRPKNICFTVLYFLIYFLYLNDEYLLGFYRI